MTKQTIEPTTIAGLLALNYAIFLQVTNGMCPKENIESVKASYLKNLVQIQVALGGMKRDFCSIRDHLDRVKDAHDNKESIAEFANFMKSELHDIEYPTVNRVYKLNGEKQAFDVIEEPADKSSKFVTNTLEDQVYSREFWQHCLQTNEPSHGKQHIFDEDIIEAAKNFLVGPCGAWRNKAILAETQSFPTLEELKESILNQSQERDMILYVVYEDTKREYSPDFKVTSESPLYVWRGSFLDKQ